VWVRAEGSRYRSDLLHAGGEPDRRGARWARDPGCPGPLEAPPPPIFVGAGNPWNCRMAGEVADGFHIARTLRENVIDNIEKGLAKAGRPRSDFTITAPVMAVMGDRDEELDAMRERVAGPATDVEPAPALRGRRGADLAPVCIRRPHARCPSVPRRSPAARGGFRRTRGSVRVPVARGSRGPAPGESAPRSPARGPPFRPGTSRPCSAPSRSSGRALRCRR